MKIFKWIFAVLSNFFNKLRVTKLEKIKQTNPLIDKTFSILEPFSLNLNETKDSLVIGKNVSIRSFCSIYLSNNARLLIGENVFFNNYCSINCLGEISIGTDSIFGEGVKIYDHNHSYKINNGIVDVARNDFAVGKVVVGKKCWIGSNVTILSNVTIGDNVIIGAGNLIFKSIPSNTIVKAKIDSIIQGFEV